MATDTARTSEQVLPYYYGRTTFRGEGLSEEGGTARAYAFDARGVANAETAARLAAALGVPGEIRTEGLTWSVGATDGTGAQLWLGGGGAVSMNYSNLTIDPWACDPGPDGGCPTAPATSVDDATAATMLADTMRALGVDPGQFEVTVEPQPSEPQPVRWVTARRIVGGTLTDDSWSAGITDAGIAWLYGTLADVVDLGTYPVVSPAEAVRRLSDPRFGQSAAMPLGARTEQADTSTSYAGPTEIPAPPSAGERIAWPVTDVTITGARLGLTQYQTESGAVLFLPAYELTDAHGTTWSVIAVVDDVLDFSARDGIGR